MEPKTSTLEDIAQALKNVGGTEGMKFEVSIDTPSLWKLAAIMVASAASGVLLYQLIKNA